MKEFIKNKLKENIGIHEKDDQKKEEGGGGKYQKIVNLLKNPIFNHSEVIRKLWNEDNATKRSLFAKKLKRETNDEGSTYEFNDEELTKIVGILMDTSTEIRKKVGKQGNV
jgi:hypothetical protein